MFLVYYISTFFIYSFLIYIISGPSTSSSPGAITQTPAQVAVLALSQALIYNQTMRSLMLDSNKLGTRVARRLVEVL